ncbi:MAG TPA: ATP synthase subunit I [Bryobacteraceae bacterium]|jgi:hypothetical protein|nr:ATP synthase subunit I [Bryobacteraceae bacterium]
MTAPDEGYYQRAEARIARVIMALAAVGAITMLIWRGWAWGVGFALGAGASWLGFHWLRQVVRAVSGEGRPRRRLALLGGLRYLLLGSGAYVIVKYSPISLAAGLAGLFVSAAAVIVEILFELMYVRN